MPAFDVSEPLTNCARQLLAAIQKYDWLNFSKADRLPNVGELDAMKVIACIVALGIAAVVSPQSAKAQGSAQFDLTCEAVSTLDGGAPVSFNLRFSVDLTSKLYCSRSESENACTDVQDIARITASAITLRDERTAEGRWNFTEVNRLSGAYLGFAKYDLGSEEELVIVQVEGKCSAAQYVPLPSRAF